MASRRYKGAAYRIDRKAIILSDPHFFHNNILKYDGRTQFFTDTDREVYDAYLKDSSNRKGRISDEATRHMGEFILEGINAEIEDPEHDTVLCLGDLVFGNSPNQYLRNAKYIRDRINCRDVRIVWGNHDEPDEIRHLFTHSYDQTVMYIERTACFLNHFPMITWDGGKQAIHLHGHVHGLYEQSSHPHPVARPKLWLAKDVGVNTNGYKPYTMSKILAQLESVREHQRIERDRGNAHLMY
jgi:calcineurin-like phosphoesterase family protein